ncbi:Nucleolar complex protein 4 [Phlyctochytrium bullatum]|nr:Nucleolar complex protein 4 [Phlyctochytrium bullatum]
MVAKRKKSADEPSSASTSKRTKLEDIKEKASDALKRKTSLGNLVELLLDLHKAEKDLNIKTALIQSLVHIFEVLIGRGDVHGSDERDETKSQVTSWLRGQLEDFIQKLLELFLHEEPSLNVIALDALLAIVKAESEYLSQLQQRHVLDNELFARIVNRFIEKKLSVSLIERLIEALNENDDLKLYFYRDVKKEHKKALSEAWLEFLRQDFDITLLKRVLLSLHREIIPSLVDPTLLIDFLVDAYDHDYPDFFKKLYGLLDEKILHTKYRSRFLRQLEFYVPGYLVAAFLKKICRIALTAPLGGVVPVLPIVYNLLKIHPGCVPLILRKDGNELDFKDLFDDKAADPAKCKAAESSLWELTLGMDDDEIYGGSGDPEQEQGAGQDHPEEQQDYDEGSEESDDVYSLVPPSNIIPKDVEIVLDSFDQTAEAESKHQNKAQKVSASFIEHSVTHEEDEQKAGAAVTQSKPGVDINAVGQYDGKDIFDADLDGFDDKPWRKPGADITDYFNYGFTEATWKAYIQKQKQLRDEQQMLKRIHVYEFKNDGGDGFGVPPFGGSFEADQHGGKYQRGLRGNFNAHNREASATDFGHMAPPMFVPDMGGGPVPYEMFRRGGPPMPPKGRGGMMRQQHNRPDRTNLLSLIPVNMEMLGEALATIEARIV